MMPEVGSAANNEKSQNNLEENREQMLGCDESDDRENRSKGDRQEQRKRPARRLCNDEEDEAYTESQDAADGARREPGLNRRAHGSNEKQISYGHRDGGNIGVKEN
jgi:hypothetical protein